MKSPDAIEAAIVCIMTAARALDDYCTDAANARCTCTESEREQERYCCACLSEDIAADASHELYILHGVMTFLEGRMAPLREPLLHFGKVMGQGNVSWHMVGTLAQTIISIVVVEGEEDDVAQTDTIDPVDDQDDAPEPATSSAPPSTQSRLTLPCDCEMPPAYIVPPPSVN